MKTVLYLTYDGLSDPLGQSQILKYLVPLSKTNKLLMLEGGSKDRDKVDWMINFTKRPINPYLEKISNNLNVEIIQKYPSMTLIRK